MIFGKVIAGTADRFSILEELSKHCRAAGIPHLAALVTTPNELLGASDRSRGRFDDLCGSSQWIIRELSVIAASRISNLSPISIKRYCNLAA
jgi:hypothetical protein